MAGKLDYNLFSFAVFGVVSSDYINLKLFFETS